jgi:hypothetical protein
MRYTKPKRKPKIYSAALAVALLMATAQHVCAFSGGYSIGINFGADEYPDSPNAGSLQSTDRAGIMTAVQPNWNNASGITGNLANLVADNDGAAVNTTATVEWTSAGTWSSTGRGEENNAFPQGPDRALMIGYLDTGNATTTTVTIQNVPQALTGSGYNVIVYALGGVSGRGGAYRVLDATGPLSDYKLVGSPANPTDYVEDDGTSHDQSGTYMVFSGVTASTLIIEATTTVSPQGGTPRAPINAVQLVQLGGDPKPIFRTPTGDAISFTAFVDDVGTAVVNPASVSVTLDGAAIQPTVTKSGSRTTIRYTLPAGTYFASGSTHPLTISLLDTQGRASTADLSFTVRSYVTVPAQYALAAAPTTAGWVIPKVHQMAAGRSPGDANSTANAEMQLAGGMVDAQGNPNPNIAEFPGPLNIGGEFSMDIWWTPYVNWERAGGQINATGAQPDNFNAESPAGEPGTAAGAYANSYTPGVELGTTAEPVNYVVETIAYVQLAAGLHRWGVNSDDGFKVSVAPGQPSPFGLILGQFNGGRGASDTIFDFVVEQAGHYPVRLLYWQGDGGASAEWFSVDLETGQKILIGDTQYYPNRAYRVFRTGQGRARISTMRPSSGFTGTQPTGPIFVQITDGRTTATNARLLINGQQVATGTKAGTVTTINYTPATPWPLGATFSGQIVYDESGQAEPITQDFTFTTRLYQLADLPAGSIWIEAEDFDYGSGQSVAAASTMPYAGGAYQGLNPVVNVDYLDTETGQFTDGAFTDGVTNYRGDSRTGVNPILSNISSETGGTLTMSRPGGFTMTSNYKIGWVGGSDWWNYTRNIPAGFYRAMAAQSLDPAGATMTSTLYRVTSGAGTTTQTTALLGTFRGVGSTGWSQNALIPLLTSNVDGAPLAAFQLPGGPVTLRWQGGAGDHDWMVLIPTTEAIPPTVRVTSPSDIRHSVFRDTTIRVEVQELTTQVQESGVTMTFDGQPVTPQFSRNGSTLTVTYDPPGLLDIGRSYPFSLTVVDNGVPPSSQTVEGALVPHYLPASPSGMFLIEAEDFNTGGGNVQAAANTMPYLGNAYVGLSAVAGTDYLRVGDPVADNAGVYRSAELVPPVPMGGNAGSVTDPVQVFDLVRAMDADRNVTWQMDVNFALGWSGQGHWFNYTRNIPSNTYQVWAAMSYDGSGEGQLSATLDRVVGSATVPDAEQVKESLGSFSAPGTGGWGNNRLVPLRDNGAIRTVQLGGNTTLRFNWASGDIDYMMLVPTGATPPPGVQVAISLQPDGKIRLEWEGNGTLQSATAIPAGPWSNLPDASPAVIDPPAAGNVFFRVQE